MYDDFEKWVNNILENDIPEGVVAVAFNIYDDGDGNWSVEAVGTSSFDEEDDDWACDEITDFGSREKNLLGMKTMNGKMHLRKSLKC